MDVHVLGEIHQNSLGSGYRGQGHLPDLSSRGETLARARQLPSA
jgi:hypothetical protein